MENPSMIAPDSINIKPYTENDYDQLFLLIQNEGDEWGDYWKGDGRPKYEKALTQSFGYLTYENEKLCGYIRCRDDNGFGIYIYDLLVDKACRGREYGRLLMEQVCRDYPESPVYVMSDVNDYYKKLGYETAGTIFVVK